MTPNAASPLPRWPAFSSQWARRRQRLYVPSLTAPFVADIEAKDLLR